MVRLFLAGAAALSIAAAANAETYAIQAGHLIVDAAQPERGNSTVIVENGRIARIDNGFTAPAGAIVIDERGRTVMPGMTDVHVHLTGTSASPGTSGSRRNIRCLIRRPSASRTRWRWRAAGSPPSAIWAAYQRGHRGPRCACRRALPGPRMKVSGAPLSIVGGHADLATGLPPELAGAVNEAHLNPSVCTGVEECQKVVRQLAAAGVDVIKVMATGGVLDPGASGLEQHFTDAELKGIADMAHAMHLKVAAHAHGARGILAATNAGIDSIEHGTFLDEAGARAMKAHGTYYDGTLMAFSGIQRVMGTGKLTPAMEAKANQTFAIWGRGLKLAYRTGVKIALGTDSAVAPHAEANKELELMVTKGGMTPRDALIAATKGGPDLMGLSNETGTLDPGKSADLIAVAGDPLVDPTAVQRVDYVMVEGRPIPMKGQ